MEKQIDEGRKAPPALDDIIVVDFTWAAAGPFCTKYLADHGATVVKVESSIYPDVTRTLGPFKDGIAHPDRAGYLVSQNSSKYSITLNLRDPKGRDLAKRLIAKADVVVESFGPGGMQKWDLEYADLTKIKKDIIMVSISIMGASGPLSSFKGWGLHAAASTGLYHLTGFPDGEPLPTSVAYIDVVAPWIAVCAILSALEHRQRTGTGQYIDLSMAETAGFCFAEALLDCAVNDQKRTRSGNRSLSAAPHGVYRCRGEDRWCAVTCLQEEHWKALVNLMGKPAWTQTPRFATLTERKTNEDELDERIDTWTSGYFAEELTWMLQRAGVPGGTVKNAEDLIEWDPQLKHREYFHRLDHPVMGPCIHQGWPSRLSKTPARITRAPLMGEHTEFILREMLGLEPSEIAELRNQGVLK